MNSRYAIVGAGLMGRLLAVALARCGAKLVVGLRLIFMIREIQMLMVLQRALLLQYWRHSQDLPLPKILWCAWAPTAYLDGKS